MLKRLIWNDVRQNKLMSVSTVFFMTISAALFILTVMLFTNLLGAIDALMDKAIVPDFMQMHAGEIEETELDRFAKSHPEVSDWQVCRFLNLDNGRLVLGGHNMADSTQDNGLAVQSEGFDFLLDMDGELPEVSPGEVFVPVCYRAKYGLAVGDEVAIFGHSFVLAGFIRDAQMNSMMASSKRFLVGEADYESLRKQGEEEYMIEFLLGEGADTNSFQDAYISGNLPANGPAITRPLVRMVNALSDGTMIFVLFLVSVIVLMISMLCIHFMLSIQMERDRKEVGMLKALGIGRKEIRRIYFTKYLLFSACGALLGLAAALAAQGPVSRQLRELYGTGGKGVSSVVFSLLAAFLAEGVILLSVRRSLRKMDKLSALEALFQGQKPGRGFTQYVLIGTVTAACAFLMLVPGNLYNTLASPSFVTYMGIGSGEFRIDVRQKDDIGGAAAQIAAALEDDTQVEKYTVLQTSSYPATLPDGSKVTLTVEAGDHLVFPVSYGAGRAPASAGEIALSALNAEELELTVGDSLQLGAEDAAAAYTVCGIYSDITNGGKTAKICGQETEMPVIWSILYVSLKESADKEGWMKRYRERGVDVVHIADYVRDTYAQTLNQLKLASRAVTGLAVLVMGVVLLLFLRLMVERNRHTISLHKALGFSGAVCARAYFIRGMLPAVLGAAAGILFGCLWGEDLCGMVLQSFGAEGFRFVIDRGWVFAEIPLLLFGVAALAVWGGTMGIKSIKAYECCMGKE